MLIPSWYEETFFLMLFHVTHFFVFLQVRASGRVLVATLLKAIQRKQPPLKQQPGLSAQEKEEEYFVRLLTDVSVRIEEEVLDRKSKECSSTRSVDRSSSVSFFFFFFFFL